MKTNRLLMACILIGLATRSFAGNEPLKNLKADTKAKDFELAQVKLLDGPFKDAQNRDIAWLKSLDKDRLLASFRKTAGLPSPAKEYGGWEAPDEKFNGIRGHYLGHYLSSLAKAYAITGDKDLKTRIDYLIAELSKCQKKSGNGYLGAFPESMFDDLIQGKKVSWVPWYTAHKLFAGLYDVYNYGVNNEVYAMLLQFTDWAKKKTDGLSTDALQQMLQTEHGGMAEVFADIYAITQLPNHLALTKRFDHKLLLDNMAAGTDILTGLHANTQIPKLIGAAREYEVTNEAPYRKAAEYFWERVALHRSSVTGGHSIGELFKEPDVLYKYLDVNEQDETCNSYNMLKLTQHLFDWNADTRYADFSERLVWNSILASQTPIKYENEPAGMMTYHQPLKPGLWKRFNDKENSFWCCTGTGSESHVQYGKYIYAYDKDGLFVNLFIASELKWTEKGLTVKQETTFPETNNIRLSFEAVKPLKMKLKIRVPRWLSGPMVIKVNGRVFGVKADPGTYAEIERVYDSKTIIEVALPMGLRQEAMPDNGNMVAFMYGPIVLSGQLGNKGLTADALFGINGKERFDMKADSVAIPKFAGVGSDLNQWIKPVVGKPLTFQTQGKGTPSDVTLVPYYKQFFERYSIYWEVKP